MNKDLELLKSKKPGNDELLDQAYELGRRDQRADLVEFTVKRLNDFINVLKSHG